MKAKTIVHISTALFCLWFIFGAARSAPHLWSDYGTQVDDTVTSATAASSPATAGPSPTQSDKSRLYGKANLMRSIKMGDSSVIVLTGDVVFYHAGNETVITCDSAIRYSPTLVAGYNNVIVHKGDTYIYGDKIDYNSEASLATVYSPIVKTIDKDAVMYTYNMSFNTEENIGKYSGGGTMYQNDNRMESENGYYYADNRELVGVGSVQMESPEYQFIADSVRYNMDEEKVFFNNRSYIWNDQGEFLTAIRGNYDTKNERYSFTDSSYIMTATQEIWADSIDYHRNTQDAWLLGNAQIVDTAEKVLAFGDYIQYWGEPQNALLTKNPSLLQYDDNQDTVYVSFDSIFLFSFPRVDSLRPDSLSLDIDPSIADSLPTVSLDSLAAASLDNNNRLIDTMAVDSVGVPAMASDSVIIDSAANLTPKDIKRLEREQKLRAKLERRELKRQQRLEHLVAKGRWVVVDSLHDHDHDDHLHADSLTVDSLIVPVLTGLPADSLATDTGAEQDSLLRIVKGYHNGRIYRADFQAISDSMVGFSVDSTIHLYKEPLLWNKNNQIQSQYIDLYTKNQLIRRAEFFGDPIMSSQADTNKFSQVKGKTMTAYFDEDGVIYCNDVVGNGQTYYYMEEEDSLGRYLTAFMQLECADMSFYFENNDIVSMTFRKQPDWIIYPIDQIPESQPQILPGFEWHGDSRPTLESVFNRYVRSTERARFEMLERPGFPLTEKMDQLRERLLKEEIWIDHVEQITPETIQYIEGIVSGAGVRRE